MWKLKTCSELQPAFTKRVVFNKLVYACILYMQYKILLKHSNTKLSACGAESGCHFKQCFLWPRNGLSWWYGDEMLAQFILVNYNQKSFMFQKYSLDFWLSCICCMADFYENHKDGMGGYLYIISVPTIELFLFGLQCLVDWFWNLCIS